MSSAINMHSLSQYMTIFIMFIPLSNHYIPKCVQTYLIIQGQNQTHTDMIDTRM